MFLHYTAEAVTALYWNRLSDHIGRKPVLLCCLAGTTTSIVLFGFSRSFRMIVLRCLPPPFLNTGLRVCDLLTIRHSRCLHGALKGIIGVVKSAMAELTDETNMARGFSSLLMAWSVGYVIGSGIVPAVPCLR